MTKNVFLSFCIAVVLVLAGCNSSKQSSSAPPDAPKTSEASKPAGIEFNKDTVTTVESISALVNKGEAYYMAASKPDQIRVQFNGTTTIKKNKQCMSCFRNLRIAPDLRIPTTEFKEHKLDLPPGLPTVVASAEAKDLVLEGPIPKDATEFIVSGPEGVTLNKVGNGFVLVKGSARLEKAQR